MVSTLGGLEWGGGGSEGRLVRPSCRRFPRSTLRWRGGDQGYLLRGETTMCEEFGVCGVDREATCVKRARLGMGRGAWGLERKGSKSSDSGRGLCMWPSLVGSSAAGLAGPWQTHLCVPFSRAEPFPETQNKQVSCKKPENVPFPASSNSNRKAASAKKKPHGHCQTAVGLRHASPTGAATEHSGQCRPPMIPPVRARPGHPGPCECDTLFQQRRA